METVDIDVLLKQATAISREVGFPEAVEFLKKLVERCFKLKPGEIVGEARYIDVNKVSSITKCLDKIRSYMESVKTIAPDEIAAYLKSIIEQLPNDNGSFDAYMIYVKYLLKLKKTDDAMRAIQAAQLLLNPYMPRYDYLRKQWNFHNYMIEISSQTKSKSARLDYIYHTFISWCLDVITAYDFITRYDEALPQNVELKFGKRTTRDTSKETYLEILSDNETLDKCLETFGIIDQKKQLVDEFCQFCAVELPEILNKKFMSQLERYYRIISEFDFPRYNELPQIIDEIHIIETGINNIMKKYIKEINIS